MLVRRLKTFLVFSCFCGHGYAYFDAIKCENHAAGRSCQVVSDYILKKIDDGWVARVQGHDRGTNGTMSLGSTGDTIDMQGYMIDLGCCEGEGVVIGGDYFSRVGVHNIYVGDGFVKGRTGIFVLGGNFRDPETELFFLKGAVVGVDDICSDYEQKSSDLKLFNLTLIGSHGDVAANNSDVVRSKLLMSRVNVIGRGLVFEENKYLLVDGGEVINPLLYETLSGELINKVDSGLPVMRSNSSWIKEEPPKVYNPHTALYLSCADNATISNNIFTAKTKIPGAYAIVLKHSKNVRITNNIFEGFTVPVLMDKYSSIIDESGNIIRPDVTADSPESKLYRLDFDRLIKSQAKPWWKFWE